MVGIETEKKIPLSQTVQEIYKKYPNMGDLYFDGTLKEKQDLFLYMNNSLKEEKHDQYEECRNFLFWSYSHISIFYAKSCEWSSKMKIEYKESLPKSFYFLSHAIDNFEHYQYFSQKDIDLYIDRSVRTGLYEAYARNNDWKPEDKTTLPTVALEILREEIDSFDQPEDINCVAHE